MYKKNYIIYLTIGFIFFTLMSGMGKLFTKKNEVPYANEKYPTPEITTKLPSDKDTIFKLPKFSANTIDDKRIHSYQFTNKILIIDFWATWCPPCVREIPHFVKLQEKYKNHIQIIGLAVSDEIEKVQAFSKSKNVNYPIIMADPLLADQFQKISGIPTTFIVNTNKNVIKRVEGYQDFEYFESIITSLIN